MRSERGVVLGAVFMLLVLVIAGVVALDFYLRRSSPDPAILRPAAAPIVRPAPPPVLEPPPTPTFIVIPINIPTSTVTAPPTPTSANAEEGKRQQEVYIVSEGDTLSAIAERFEVSVESIIAENNISDPSLIQVGQELVIPVE